VLRTALLRVRRNPCGLEFRIHRITNDREFDNGSLGKVRVSRISGGSNLVSNQELERRLAEKSSQLLSKGSEPGVVLRSETLAILAL